MRCPHNVADDDWRYPLLQAAYVPNAHLARRYPDERWNQFIEDEAQQEKFPDYIPE